MINKASMVDADRLKGSQVDVSRSIGLGSISALQLPQLEDPEAIAITVHRQRPIPSTIGHINRTSNLTGS